MYSWNWSRIGDSHSQFCIQCFAGALNCNGAKYPCLWMLHCLCPLQPQATCKNRCQCWLQIGLFVLQTQGYHLHHLGTTRSFWGFLWVCCMLKSLMVQRDALCRPAVSSWACLSSSLIHYSDSTPSSWKKSSTQIILHMPHFVDNFMQASFAVRTHCEATEFISPSNDCVWCTAATTAHA